jgi:hypothetical protein
MPSSIQPTRSSTMAATPSAARCCDASCRAESTAASTGSAEMPRAVAMNSAKTVRGDCPPTKASGIA